MLLAEHKLKILVLLPQKGSAQLRVSVRSEAAGVCICVCRGMFSKISVLLLVRRGKSRQR